MEATTQQKQAAPPPRLRERYEQEVLPGLIERFGYSSPMAAPTLDKIVLNMGVGEAKQDTKLLEAAMEQLTVIAGQRPNIRRAKKSVATFKVREGMPVGLAVTLRRARMWEFLDRLCSISIPRIRDFRGLNPRSFDGRGNYSMGIREQIIFPEIDYDAIDQVERRKQEEAQKRAEAEAAALEQLKEENPDAYAAPEKPEEGEEGEGEGTEAGEGGDDASGESAADGESSEGNEGEDG
jgi:large subunit ribosomal protein L5